MAGSRAPTIEQPWRWERYSAKKAASERDPLRLRPRSPPSRSCARSARVSMQSIPHLFPDCRLSSAGAEHQVNQAKYVTMRHENQPSLTGLVLLAHCTQHWFGAVPLFSSCTACMHRTVLGYYQVVPAGLCATNSCRNSGAGKECTSYRTVCVILPWISNPVAPRRAVGGKAGTNVETPDGL